MSKLQIRERDIKILRHIGSQNFAIAKEIKNLFWDCKSSSDAHYRRLACFMRADLVTKLEDGNNKNFGYVLTEKGRLVLEELGYSAFHHSLKKDKYQGSYKHDLLVNEVKNILFKSAFISNFIPECQIAGVLLKDSKIKSEYQKGDKIPDGLFTLQFYDKPERVALELELSQKSQSRYDKIFTKHLLTNNWGTVFYIVKGKKLRDKLMIYLEEVKSKNVFVKTHQNKNDIYFALLEEVLTKELSASFISKDVSFSLKKLEQRVKKKL